MSFDMDQHARYSDIIDKYSDTIRSKAYKRYLLNRHLEVIRLRKQGYRVSQIARKLFITPSKMYTNVSEYHKKCLRVYFDSSNANIFQPVQNEYDMLQNGPLNDRLDMMKKVTEHLLEQL